MRRLLLIAAIALPQAASAADSLVDHAVEVQDQKAVVATVEPVRQLVARARLGGTIVSLKAKEGERAEGGAELVTIADPKLVLQTQALDARIQSQKAQLDKAKIDLDRADELQRKGVSTQGMLDDARTAYDVVQRTLDAMRGDRSVVAQQMSEGAVLAPGPGRILTVRVSEGRVVMPRETIATLAEDRYILRLQLPERHAQFIRTGDTVQIGSRGLAETIDEGRREGRVATVYPEIEGGRVIADVRGDGLGDYFVGERTLVWLSAGARRVIIVPAGFVFRRAGVNYVKTVGGAEMVVQPASAETTGSKFSPAWSTATRWSRHEPRPLRRADARVHPLAADPTPAAGGARRRRARARLPAARGGAANQRADGRRHGDDQRLQGPGRGRACHPAARGHRQGRRRRRARLLREPPACAAGRRFEPGHRPGAMIRLRGADDDIGDVLDVDRTAVARGQQQQTNVRHALQGLADDDRQRAAVLAQRANDEGAVGVGQFVDELIERHAIERKPLWVGFDANLSTIAQAALAPGALDAKTKELIALAIGVSSHCDDCIAFHAKAAVDQGATRDEVLETLGMAIYMRAGPSAMYASHALGAFTQFEAAKTASTNNG